MITSNASLLPATTTTATGGASQDSLLDKDVFMTLLIQQLQNQDPLDPMDNQEMTAQLAQLTSLEELQKVNGNLETLQMYESSLNNAQSVSLIGKYVRAVGDQVTLGDEGSASVPFYLADDAASVTVEILNEDGDTVKVIEMQNVSAGDNETVWDGTNTSGTEMDPGTYTYNVTAKDTEGNAVAVDTFFEGVVESVRFEGGVPILVIDGQEVSAGDIYEINLQPPDQTDG